MLLQAPLVVPDNSELRLTMWRKTDDRKVWYEWLVDVYAFLSASPTTAPALSRTPTQNAGPGDAGKGKGRVAPPVATGISGTGRADGTVARKGRKTRIGGSDLHSSEKEACLM